MNPIIACQPMSTTIGISDYLPATWTLFEMGALNLYQFIPHDPMAAYGPNHGACIIPPPNGNPAAR